MRRFSPGPEKSPLQDITPAPRVGSHTTTKGETRLGKRGDKITANADSASPFDNSTGGMHDQVVHEPEEAANSTAQFDDSYVNFAANGDDDHTLSNGNKPQDLEEPQLPEPQLPEQAFDDEEADQTPEPCSDMPVEEQGPAKANSGKKRKSDAVEPDTHADSSSPTAKKARKIVEDKHRRATVLERSNSVQAEASNEVLKPEATRERGRLVAKGKSSTAQMSARQEAELEQIVERVKARPGQSKSLYILRRETPTDDGVTHTKSGRVSVKPLAYWRNERCVYGGSPGASNLQDGARFPLNSIKEIIRTEEVDTSISRQKAKRKGRKGKSKARSSSSAFSGSDDESNQEDPDMEPWESAVGIFRGPVSVWDSQQQTPLEEEEEVELAYAPASIQTREVPGSTFRYAKLVSMGFFGSGIVDLPPGGLKRPKNSRRMHMSFFVAKGRVTVQTGPLNGEESRFSVGKGGFWQVPRGETFCLSPCRSCSAN